MSRGLILAGPHSGSGKTTLTLALLRALARAGQRVVSAKAGPDYIDPAFHAAASGAPCLNLDSWAMRPQLLETLVRRLERASEFILCEGTMGLFDGVGSSERGSTAELAQRLGWPVVLVVDAARQGASVAALLEGFAGHRADVTVAGVIFNRVGSARHREILAEATRAALPNLVVLGAVPRDPALTLPERHLGLVQAGEHADLDRFLDGAADIVDATCNLRGLAALAQRARLSGANEIAAPLPPLGQRIAIAADVAFAFAYPAVLEGWRHAGAELNTFSPLADEAPDAGADAVYLPGGYPELHAGRIAANRRFLGGLRDRASAGATIYGECGGYMVLGEGLIDAEGERHAMAGLLPVTTSFAERSLHLGYREMRLIQATPLGTAGTAFRGHEFHYAKVAGPEGAAPLFETSDGMGAPLSAVGAIQGSVLGSFLHLVDRAELSARIG
ncbi:MAG TPA: cobyrinate a,c-diamide synthase [Stellaceae bacterium]|nr:cobyrinate a,c-diamide synthase [Stellaceae bacterium]